MMSMVFIIIIIIKRWGLALLPRLEWSGVIITHRSLRLLGSRDPLISASLEGKEYSRVAGNRGPWMEQPGWGLPSQDLGAKGLAPVSKGTDPFSSQRSIARDSRWGSGDKVWHMVRMNSDELLFKEPQASRQGMRPPSLEEF